MVEGEKGGGGGVEVVVVVGVYMSTPTYAKAILLAPEVKLCQFRPSATRCV
jgi:hypothetical protein